MKELGIGVIGLGMGENMFQVNKDPVSKMEVRGLCDVDKELLSTYSKKYNIKFTTTDYRDLLVRDDIHIIGIFSPDHLHGEQAIASLKAGKHVICTKPMVTTLKDCEEIVKLVDKTGLKFFVGHTMRFTPEFLNVKKLHDDGDLGEIIFAESHYVDDARAMGKSTPWRLTVPQDFMFGGASHPIDVLRWFLGDVEEVHVYANKSGMIKGYPIEDNFLINLKFPNGKIARLLAAYGIVHPPMPQMGLELYCTKASVKSDYSDFLGGHIRIVFDKMLEHRETVMNFPPVTEGRYGLGKAVRSYMAHFEDCILNDKQPSPDAREGAKTISTGVSGWESVKTGKPVKVFNNF